MTFLLVLIFFYSMKPMYLDVTEWSTFPRFYSVQAPINMHNSFVHFMKYSILANWNHEYRNLLILKCISLFSYSKLLVLLTEPGVLTCQVSSVIHYLLFLLSPLSSVIGFSKLNTTIKIPQFYHFTWDTHPFIHPGIPALFIFPSACIWHH